MEAFKENFNHLVCLVLAGGFTIMLLWEEMKK
jgi:hypothetical protein